MLCGKFTNYGNLLGTSLKSAAKFKIRNVFSLDARGKTLDVRSYELKIVLDANVFISAISKY